MNKNKFALLVLLTVVLVLAGIQGFSDDSTHIESLSSPPYKIGAILFLTGNQAPLGEEVRNSLLLAEELRNSDSETKFELVVEDSADNPATAISAYNKLKAEGIPAMISTGDQVGSALVPRVNEDEIVLVHAVAGSDGIVGDYNFRVHVTGSRQAEIIGEFAHEDLGLERIGLIYINNVFGEDYKNALERTLKNGGLELVSEESYGLTDTDVRTQITKTIADNPDAIAVAGFGPAYPVVFRQLRELGWDGIVLTDATLPVPFFLDAVGVENLKNTYSADTSFSVLEPANEDVAEFVQLYEERYGNMPSWVGAFVFDSYHTLTSAIEECGYESTAIQTCLVDSTDQIGLLGSLDFSSRDLKVPLYVRKFHNGEMTVEKVIE